MFLLRLLALEPGSAFLFGGKGQEPDLKEEAVVPDLGGVRRLIEQVFQCRFFVHTLTEKKEGRR